TTPLQSSPNPISPVGPVADTTTVRLVRVLRLSIRRIGASSGSASQTLTGPPQVFGRGVGGDERHDLATVGAHGGASCRVRSGRSPCFAEDPEPYAYALLFELSVRPCTSARTGAGES